VKRAGIVFALLALFGSLAGCGIRPTGVLTGGKPPVGVAPGPVLYFFVNGKLAPVQRDAGHLGTPLAALELLFAGPLPEEGKQGATTALPPIADFGSATVDLDQAVARVYVPIDALNLSADAMDQLVCTVNGVEGQAGTDRHLLTAVVTGTTGTRQSARCPLFDS
jgi:hypothetical protein